MSEILEERRDQCAVFVCDPVVVLFLRILVDSVFVVWFPLHDFKFDIACQCQGHGLVGEIELSSWVEVENYYHSQ